MESHMALPPVEVHRCSPTGWRRGASPEPRNTHGCSLGLPLDCPWDPASNRPQFWKAGQLASQEPSPGHCCHRPLAWCCSPALH
eukprot:7026118-Alexandrium_andersonii.AAC.1